jgi:hypothetical protein
MFFSDVFFFGHLAPPDSTVEMMNGEKFGVL